MGGGAGVEGRRIGGRGEEGDLGVKEGVGGGSEAQKVDGGGWGEREGGGEWRGLGCNKKARRGGVERKVKGVGRVGR